MTDDDIPTLVEQTDAGFAKMMVVQPPSEDMEISPLNSGQTMVQAQGRVITAQRVIVERNLPKVLATIRDYAAEFGEDYVYSWEVENRNGTKTTIEGPTIRLANDLIGIWKNCATDVEIDETKTHWIIKAYFMDYENGTCTCRPFMQRKKNTMGGKYDADRALDIVFQIGVSKAIRNVVVNSLRSMVSYAMDEARKNMSKRFRNPENQEKAWIFIRKVLEENKIADGQVEAVRGRKMKDFIVRDLARTYSECVAIREGFAVAREVYPSNDVADAIADQRADDEEDRQQHALEAARGTKPVGSEEKPITNGDKSQEVANNGEVMRRPEPPAQQRQEAADPPASSEPEKSKPAKPAEDGNVSLF